MWPAAVTMSWDRVYGLLLFEPCGVCERSDELRAGVACGYPLSASLRLHGCAMNTRERAFKNFVFLLTV